MILVVKFGRNGKIDEVVEPHFELPCKSDGTYLNKQIFNKLLDEYYTLRERDPATGIPIKEKLKELNLTWLLRIFIKYIIFRCSITITYAVSIIACLTYYRHGALNGRSS